MQIYKVSMIKTLAIQEDCPQTKTMTSGAGRRCQTATSDDTRRTIHDCIGSLAFMPNEPKTNCMYTETNKFIIATVMLGERKYLPSQNICLLSMYKELHIKVWDWWRI